MGVLGLWQILDSIGHPIKIEGLEGKRLGVDANVWLYKFIRGFREKDNASSIDSHKLGLFNRVSKLLFYKIKPIFVFDGPAPVLKRRTLERRQNVRNKHLEKAQDVAMKVIADQLKGLYPSVDIDNVKIPLPDLRSHNLVAAEKFTDEDRELFYLPPEVKEVSDDEDVGDDKADDVFEIKPNIVKIENQVYYIDSDDDIKPDLKPSVDIHSEEFAKLPAEIRYEMLKDIKEERRRIRRTHALPEDANSFSNLQLERLRNRRTIQEKIEQCERDICSAYTGECDGGGTVRSFRMQSDATSTMLYVQHKPSGELYPFKSETEQQQEEQQSTADTSQSSMQVQSESQKPDHQVKRRRRQEQGEPLIRPELMRRLRGTLSQREPSPELRLSPDGEKSPETRLSPEEEDQSSPTPKDPLVTLSPKPKPTEQPSSPLNPPISSPKSQVEQSSIVELSPNADQPSTYDDSVVILSPESKQITKQPTIQDDSVVILSPEPKQLGKECPSEDDSVVILSPEPKQSEPPTKPTSPTLQPQSEQQSHKNNFPSEEQIFLEVSEWTDSDDEEKDDVKKTNPSTESSSKQDKPTKSVEPQPKPSEADNVPSEKAAPAEEQSTSKTQKPEQQSQPRPYSQIPHYSQQPTAPQASRTNKVTAKIVEEAKELLRLFGVPYIDATGEAEAQCALLEELNLTEGTITDDSDVWLFGAKNVYRYFFSDDKFVMQYKMTDIEFHIRMNRENLVCFAMLVGSDYTDGIMNIGPVTALEVLSEFPGENMEPLEKFKNWKVKYEASEDRIPGSRKREKLLKFRLPDEFPSRTVYEGYMRPVADASTEKFTWGTPELDELREYARRNFGWDSKKIDDKLLPVMKKLSERKTQPTIDTFFFKTAANQNPELFRSKRVNQALDKISKTTSRKAEEVEVILTEDEDDSDGSVESKKRKAPAATTKRGKAPPKGAKSKARGKKSSGAAGKAGESSSATTSTSAAAGKRRKVKSK